MNVILYLDVPAEKTCTFLWTGQDVVRTGSKVGVLEFPDPKVDDMNNTVYMMFIYGNHFLHLQPKGTAQD
jgi:hypothetical protein